MKRIKARVKDDISIEQCRERIKKVLQNYVSDLSFHLHSEMFYLGEYHSCWVTEKNEKCLVATLESIWNENSAIQIVELGG